MGAQRLLPVVVVRVVQEEVPAAHVPVDLVVAHARVEVPVAVPVPEDLVGDQEVPAALAVSVALEAARPAEVVVALAVVVVALAVVVVALAVVVVAPVNVPERRSGVVRLRSSARRKPHASRRPMHQCPKETSLFPEGSLSKNLHQN